MSNPALHDVFVLLDGSHRIAQPGAARVTAGLSANLDTQSVPGGGQVQAQLNEAQGEVTVDLQMWYGQQWVDYRAVLLLLRQGTASGPAVFTCAHPEVTTRKIKRLYFDSEVSQPYSPRTGYQVKLVFKEKLKAAAPVTQTGDGAFTLPGSGTTGSGTSGGNTTGSASSTAAGRTLYATALAQSAAPGIPVGDGKTTASGGYCSAFDKRAWMATHNGDGSLYGGTALETERKFTAAGYTIPWGAAASQNIQEGDQVAYGNDPSGSGHIGIYDGHGGVLSNNLVTYKARGGLFDAAGRATGYDANGSPVDARGTVPILSLGTPTSIIKPEPIASGTPLPAGPAAPLGPSSVPPKAGK